MIRTIAVTLAFATLATGASAADNQLSRSERKAGWILLFDGKTTDGWRGFKQAGADLGWGRRSLADVISDLIAALEAGEHEIDTAPEGHRGMQELNVTDPLAVDAALAPGLAALEVAVRDHRSI